MYYSYFNYYLFSYISYIECDENQHKNYEKICENRRSMEIFEDLNFKPIIFIRFNPDSYIENNIKHKSIFTFDKLNNIKINLIFVLIN